MRRRARAPFAGLVLAAVYLSAACNPGFYSASVAPLEPVVPVPTSGTVAELLDSIPVKGRAPRTGYDRDELFGDGWLDLDRNGCDQRNDILARDLVDVAHNVPGGCVVVTGELLDPYTGELIEFTRGEDTSSDVQIDHVVSLSNAWQTGAQQLTEPQRLALANDPLNLQATDGATNQAKGDGDAATWLPPNRRSWCSYVAVQVEVKARYGLWMTAAEHARIGEILDGCPAEPVGAPGGIVAD